MGCGDITDEMYPNMDKTLQKKHAKLDQKELKLLRKVYLAAENYISHGEQVFLDDLNMAVEKYEDEFDPDYWKDSHGNQ